MPDDEGLAKALKPEMDKGASSPPSGPHGHHPLLPDPGPELKSIIQLKLKKIQKRLLRCHRIELVAQPGLIEEVARALHRGRERRPEHVDSILTNTLLPEVSTMLLGAMVGGTKPTTIRMKWGTAGCSPTSREGSQPVGAGARAG
ncbi:MAG: hypothetical protein U0133_10975 [Gemmatimonadales bacterium]